jgi:peptidoglycan hydrolase CwlO-like protein
VQRTIDQMNDQVEALVERYNANREALARTQAAQVSTSRRIERARRELASARQQLDQWIWATYTGGAQLSTLAGLVNATDLYEALTTAKYQEDVVDADRRTLARVERAEGALDALAAQPAAQRRALEGLQARRGLPRRRQRAYQLDRPGRLHRRRPADR